MSNFVSSLFYDHRVDGRKGGLKHRGASALAVGASFRGSETTRLLGADQPHRRQLTGTSIGTGKSFQQPIAAF